MKQSLLKLLPLIFISFFFCCIPTLRAQNVVNNGGFIVVQPGAFMVISDDYINRNDGSNDGSMALDGTIILRRNWVNTAHNNVITGIGSSPDGDVIMDGTINQYIEGNSPTHFENLIIRNSDKFLNVTNCEVSGRLTVDAVLHLNSKKLVIKNPSQTAITYVSKYIESETTPIDGYGEIQWNIGDNVLSYEVPFGSGMTSFNDLDLVVAVKTPGDPAGAVSFATYPSECDNSPLPQYVSQLDWDKEFVADRYWIIDPLFPTMKPSIDIVFKYTDADVNPGCNGSIQEAALKAARYSTLSNQWDDMTPAGLDDPSTNTLVITDVGRDDFFAPWALVGEQVEWEIFVPNAFTPNEDGLNDGFGPVGFNMESFKTYDFYIYDRWGEELFHSNDPAKTWNGSVNNEHKTCQDGIYVWMISVTDYRGKEHVYHGTLSLLGNKNSL